MMKKILHILCLCLVGFISQAQDRSQHHLFMGNAAVDYQSEDNKLRMQMQVGSPIISSLNTNTLNTRTGFPYGILYISPTFVVDGLEISKGYYTDKILIQWKIGANEDNIKNINIYRKEYGSIIPMQLVATVAKDIFEYADSEVQGGTLYEYKIEAEGVSVLNERYTNYIDGVGFRNPTATVSGSISFEGGSPVQDVLVFAEADGVANDTTGKSLKIDNGYVAIENIEKDIAIKNATLQAWVTNFGEVFRLTTNNNQIVKVYAGKVNDSQLDFVVYIDQIPIKKINLFYSYPTGELDIEGNDVFRMISELDNESFVHVSVVLEDNLVSKFYLNGRELTNEYINSATVTEGVFPPQMADEFVNDGITENSLVEKIVLGADGYKGYIDEVRIWDRVLPAAEIRRDYRRYISGGEKGLSLYLRMDEAIGNNVYDLSKKGFEHNKNDGYFVHIVPDGVSFSNVKPTKKQLGVFGVTDPNGSYTISSIQYSGIGESFVITPTFGVHTFEPASQTLFLGAEASVVNQLNFKDVSSFKFNGRAVYNVQDVFSSVELSAEEKAYTQIKDISYNKYRVNSNGSEITINKGEYYYEGGSINGGNGLYEGGALKKYPVIGLENANVYIDGDIVISEDNQPVVTDENGDFTINVPIGKHKVEVRKDGHTFVHNGYFPSSGTFDFFEDNIDPTYFIDSTRISLVGRVVGGRIESEKSIGFGLDGKFTYTNNEGQDNEEKEIISSTNNIGSAQITFKGDSETSILDVIVKTDSLSGEYEARLIPYIYHIKPVDLKIPSNTALNKAILTSPETLNLLATPVLDSIKHVTKDGTELYSKAFHHKKSFRYNAPTTLSLITQTFEETYKIEEQEFDISNLEVPLYLQNRDYNMVFEVTQNYINQDNSDEKVETKEYYNEGRFNITNNLALGEGTINRGEQNGVEQYLYTFRAGEPNAAHDAGFKKTMSVEYILANNTAIPVSNAIKTAGIIKGSIEPEGTPFVTVAPEVPDIILRDPPGSNSFASIEKGTTISFVKSNSKAEEGAIGGGVFVSLAPVFRASAGTPFFSVETKLEPIATVDTNFNHTQQLNLDGSATETYEFTKTISTSDDPNDVGADADIYIGNAKNEYYGICNSTFITSTAPTLKDGTSVPSIKVTDKDEKDLYISFQETYFIAEQPTSTFFVYTQRHIIESLIPDLEKFAATAPETVDSTSKDPDQPKTRKFYEDQISLWKKIIQDNERDKYLALNNKESLKTTILATNSLKIAEREKTKSALKDQPFVLQRGYDFFEFDKHQANLNTLINDNFDSNVSIDFGVGEYTSSTTTSVISEKSYTKTIDFSTEFVTQLGLLVSDAGAVVSITGNSSYIDETSFSSEEETTTTFSYTLKNNDIDNVISVDVVNLFDGYGPLFITKGGATSCPYEEATVSNFYEHSENYDKEIVGNGGEKLNVGTTNVYKSEITSDKTELTNIPESEGALFNLTLKNNSETKSALEYIVRVAALTLNGAETNIEPNGVNVYIPYNETINFPFEVYKTSASDIFKYENIRVYLEAPCDDINSSDSYIDVSVEFKKSCSNVVVAAPQDNFIFNIAEGYSKDIDGNITTNTLPITFTDFNTDFAGFQKIELQYRNASSANWIKFKTYYGSEDLKNAASDNDGIVIKSSDSELTFNWDIIDDKVPDGKYEIRAISYCTDNITNISPIISGTINLNAPVLFGTPQPSDGILDVGEDISIRFNEAVSERVGTSIKVSGLQNQQEIDHSVSVYLDGSNNQIALPNQILPDGSFTLQFWYKNATIGSGKLISQQNGIQATLNGNDLTFSIGEASVTATIDSSQYNFYSLVYQAGRTDGAQSQKPLLLVFKNGDELEHKELDDNLDLNTNSTIFIGGTNVIGNIHDIRFWSKPFTGAQANVAKDKTLSGRELNLLGYWTLDEGHGSVGVDRAKSRNATVNLGWDIKPKGAGYAFSNNQYLSLDNVGFVQPSYLEDITLSFWIKIGEAKESTIFSNGRGTDEEPLQTNGFRNKWSLNMKADGNLELMSDNTSYSLTTKSIADDTWHHVAVVVKRGGSINSYIDAMQATSVSSEHIGGISGNKIVVGARFFEDAFSNKTINNHFTGMLDEIRLWNTARSFEQLKRDRYFEINHESVGLMLHIDFNDNEETKPASKGPSYYHYAVNNEVESTYADIVGTQNYTEDSPPLKPMLKFTSIPISTVINGDQMIIQPELTDEEWSLYEGEILDFSVSGMFDEHFNQQKSPITWSAFVNKQEIEWFTANQTKEIVAGKNTNEPYSFTMDIVNKGGSNQPYTISGLPTWITAESTSGNVSPSSTKQVTFTVDEELSMGIYNATIYLETASAFNDKLTLDLRVLSSAPDWSVNAAAYSNSMNIIGMIKVNDVLSRDKQTKIGAFIDGNPRGEAYLKYDAIYDSYYVFLTAYSNVTSAEKVSFKIWDANNGKILIATIDNASNINFLQNEILGSKSNPVIFSGALSVEQEITLNKGWTWTSFFLSDSRFNNIKSVFEDLTIEDDDQIKSQNNFTRFETDNWYGSLAALNNTEMYKIKLANENTLMLNGDDVDETNLNIAISEGWNWLPFPIHKNTSLEEALTFYNPTDGDVIKDQYSFAIYDANSGWSGTLNYMHSGKGYMIKSGTSQTLNYPESNNYQSRSSTDNSFSEEYTLQMINQFSQYNANMNVIAQVTGADTMNKVDVFDEDNILRGSSPIVQQGDHRMSFITVFSNNNDRLKFKLSDGISEVDVASNFIFENDKVYGNMQSPVILNAGSLSTGDELLNTIHLYPNPFSESISVSSSSNSEKVSKIVFYNVLGILVKSITTSSDKTVVDTKDLSQGVYFIKVTADSGSSIIKKLIKK